MGGLRWATNIAVGAGLVALLLLGVGPRFGRYRTFTVLSASMRPGMPPGALVVSTRESLGSVRVGQVITYTIPDATNEVVTHRVVERSGPADAPVVRTKGDANAAADPWTAVLHDHAWRARIVVPHAGTVLLALRNRMVRPLLVGLLPFLVAAIWIRDVWRSPATEDDPESADAAAVNNVDSDSDSDSDVDDNDDDNDKLSPVPGPRATNTWHDARQHPLVVRTPRFTARVPLGGVAAAMPEDDGSTFLVALAGDVTVEIPSISHAVVVPPAHALHLTPDGGVGGLVHATAIELLGDPWIGENADDALAASIASHARRSTRVA